MATVIREVDPWDAGWRKMPEGHWLLPTGKFYLFPPGVKEKLVVYDEIGPDEIRDFRKSGSAVIEE